MTPRKRSRPAAPRFEDLPEFVTIDEAAALLRVGRGLLYGLVKSGEIRSVKFGRLIRIPKDALRDKLAE